MVLRHRRCATDELVGMLERPTPASPWRVGALDAARAARATQRAVCGFASPLRESALTAVALRELGHCAGLVVGVEPVPDGGRRRLCSWVEVGGRVVSTDVPVETLCQVLARYPEKAGR
ncbi:hypothetical protein ACFP1Z_27815 [Streptomyces gamaensis]|uniref:Lasso peptide biosynthesis B2 protein n=1 Tax=Streptomyces gamaensis TaxID=1763542 RepID=A0ABW0Z8Z3_9ACTN